MKKRSVSFRPEIWAEVVQRAGEEGGQVSALVNTALAYYLNLRQGLDLVKEWEAEHGALAAEELAEADRLLDEAGVVRGPQVATWQD
ncbi:MAG: hypothetical protein HY690_18880 [Chloroflexi bacterium]|nr:hypothetical protein [Chloroflexota bacterium]